MKFTAGSSGLVLGLVGCSQAFVTPPVTGLGGRVSAGRSAASASGPRMMLPMAPFAGAAVAHLIGSNPINPEHLVSAKSQPTHLVAYKETREGLYGPYEVEVQERAPETDFGISTFKKKEETEEGRDKYTSVLAVLLAGSFVIPMVQYWWYIRDDDREIR
ncbi:conserved unknown protein [Ectocarpus siliculosus]|uniref:Uncharacterized protein n=1 Tax=Ectocarpus siliculosus TaxID=2880 RepID=D8LTU5_ECTSI|nr:conserved unknown protein [Ectocarpus siliculosus]|eukprot:CBN73992.1 conserved unknown protein [Ectocarpus siliculosus]